MTKFSKKVNIKEPIDPEKLKIMHAASHRGMKIRKYIPRAFGRASAYFNTLTHIELIGYETE